jgi:serine/threonine-protein kinase
MGGRGAVYRARDTRLGREVAIKLLSDNVKRDPERLARVEREARLLASLNHPNIAAIHGIEDGDGGPALVMELVEGPTLADRIAKGATPVDETLAIAKQIAAALEAAHERGIIHRDLKPSNIKVRSDGTVKVLDFGLAKAIDPLSSRTTNQADSPSAMSAMTAAGAIVGTVAYMAPEQARGQMIDARADIWSFGCVLYEMLTGRRAFDGADMSTTLASVLKDDVRWDALTPEVPSSVRRLLRRCLEKDPKRRLSAIADARLELDDAAVDVSDVQVTASSVTGTNGSRRRIVSMALATLLGGLVTGGAVFSLTRHSPEPSRVERFVVSRADAPPELASSTPSVWMSADGTRIVYRTGLANARPPLLMRDRSTFEPTVLTGTEGGVNAFFSPDGKWIGFFDGSDSALKRMPAAGGSAQIICKVDGLSFGASWGDDDQIVFATLNSKGLMRVSATGGEPQVLTRIDTGEAAHFWPETLPGGQGVLFTVWNGSPERSSIAVASRSDGHVSTLVVGGTYPRYAYNGYLLFGRAGKLWAARFDPARLVLMGDPTPVVDDVALTPYGGAHYAIGTNGSLVYGTGRGRSDARALVWVDRQGRQEPINLPPRPYAAARVSPDGTKLALDIRDEQNDIWVWDLTTETLQNLTLDAGEDRLPVWTPDGSHVAFDSERDGGLRGIFWRRADGSEPVERIDTGTRSQAPTSFSPDGKRLVVLTPLAGTGPIDIGLLDLGNPPRETMLVTSSFAKNNGVVSPDGRWLAYESNESGRLEIYVRPFPNVATSRHLVSSGGGSRPLWSKDGRELFYWVDPGTVMTVPVKLGATLSFEKPTVAVKGQYVRPATVTRHYDISGDGKRFLLMKDPDAPGTGKPAQPEVRLVLHFADELDRLVGSHR